MMSPKPMTTHDVYERAEKYWSRVSQDVNGMLGGYAPLHEPDIAVSKAFINSLKTKNYLTKCDYALDCGAGIGRVTKHLLMNFFKTVDLVDVIEELIAKSAEYIGKDEGIGEKFVEGLQTFAPPEKRYDVIWIQWVSGHLSDEDFKEFLERCAKGLTKDGLIVLKDNVTNEKSKIFDDEDSSWTRPESLVFDICDKAGLRLVTRNIQTGFPKGMYPVKLFAFKPKNTEVEEDD